MVVTLTWLLVILVFGVVGLVVLLREQNPAFRPSSGESPFEACPSCFKEVRRGRSSCPWCGFEGEPVVLPTRPLAAGDLWLEDDDPGQAEAA
jgi:hypothetical protein